MGKEVFAMCVCIRRCVMRRNFFAVHTQENITWEMGPFRARTPPHTTIQHKIHTKIRSNQENAKRKSDVMRTTVIVLSTVQQLGNVLAYVSMLGRMKTEAKCDGGGAPNRMVWGGWQIDGGGTHSFAGLCDLTTLEAMAREPKCVCVVHVGALHTFTLYLSK